MGDEQPRDEQGRFASTGGGGADKKSAATHAGNKADEASKNAYEMGDKKSHLDAKSAHETALDAAKAAGDRPDAVQYHHNEARNHGRLADKADKESVTPSLKSWAEKKVSGKEGEKKLTLSKKPSEMSAGDINKHLDKLDKHIEKATDDLIAAGRGDERHSETMSKSDPLSLKYREAHEMKQELKSEISKRYGPGAPHRLPKSFGPIKGGM